MTEPTPPQPQPETKQKHHRWRRIASAAATISGLLHLFPGGIGAFVTPAFAETFYGSATNLVASFFVGLGLFQLLLGYALRRSGSRVVLTLGILGFLFSISLYLVSLFTPLTIGTTVVPQQPIVQASIFPFVTKLVEAIFVVSSVNLLRSMPK